MLSEVHINMPNRHSTLTSLFVDIADSIRSKTGDSAKIRADDVDTAIEAIQTGGGGTSLKGVLDATKSCYYLFSGYLGNSVDDLISYNDTSNVEEMALMFRDCDNLTTIPLLETSKVTSMKDMFSSSHKLATIPKLDTSNVIIMSSMFSDCTSLTSVPDLVTSNVTNMGSMFYSCKKLAAAPQLDTSKVTDMGSMFNGCSSLTSVPLYNTSNVTTMGSMFSGCSSLTTVPQFDTSKVKYMNSMFGNCKKLTAVPQFDASKATNLSYMFSGCSSLKSILMTGMSVNFDISPSTKFEESDLVTILNNLATVTQTRTLTMGATNLAKLTDAEKAIATNKGWTLK